jgi:calcium-dependent protein kinase
LFDNIVEKVAYTEYQAAKYMRKIFRAVKYLHGLNIVHRDLKPDNFLFDKADDPRSEIKIIDFGLSVQHKALKTMRTQVGTPFYVAPEVLRGKYDQSCDCWSLGIILYVMLAGYPPFIGEKQDEIFH